MFALYGERWGKATPDGVRVELPLTHELLAKLCDARRPTVTVAIKSLKEHGFLTRASHEVWLLHRRPELRRGSACWGRMRRRTGVQPSQRAAEDALGQLDWCIGYFDRIHKGRISAQLAKNTAHIRRSLLREAREPTETRRES